MAKVIQFGPAPGTVDYGAPIVSHREHWADAWVPDLRTIALEAVWCSAPALPTATIQVRYGYLSFSGFPEWVKVDKHETWPDQFVKIQFPMVRIEEGEDAGEWEYRTWYGVVALEEDQLGGCTFKTTRSGNTTQTQVTASGLQTFSAYGLEKLLADWPIKYSVINDGGSLNEVKRALTFNRDGKPNRTAAKILGSHAFESDLTVAQFWSTRDIAEYLLEWQTPRDSAGNRLVLFKLAGLGLPDWDKPAVSQETQSCGSLLTSLINRRQMLSWRLTVDEDITPDEVHVDVFSLARTEITLPITGTPKIEPSSRQKSIEFDKDQSTRVTLKRSKVGVYHQVILRGAPMRAVGSFSFVDGTLVAGWDSSLQTLYDAGASLSAGYSALDDEEKRVRDAAARGVSRLEEVYSFFRIPTDWDRKVADGENGFKEFLFAGDVAGESPVYLGTCFVEPTMPLIQGVDYSTDKIANGAPGISDFTIATNLEETPPLVFFKRPDQPTKWIAGDKLGTAGELPRGYGSDGNTRFSVSVQVPNESKGLVIRVQGDPQHAIAPTDFAPLAVDEQLGGVDWRSAIVTLSLPFDQHAEGIWPEDLPANVDCPRILILEAGDRYKKHYVAPNTVVGVDKDGALVRSTGGWIPKAGTDDDETKLTALAKVAHAWYGEDHCVLTLETSRLFPIADLDVGDLITEIGNKPPATGGHRATVNTTISEIRLQWPESEGTEAQAPVLTIVTGSGELDPIQPGDDPRRPVAIETPLPGPEVTAYV